MLTRFPALTPVILGIKNLRTRLWRTTLTLIGIILGVAVVLAIEITNKSTIKSIENVFGQATGNAELVVIPIADEPDFDGSIIDRIRRIDGVNVAAPSLMVRTLLENENTGSGAHWGTRGIELGRSFEVRGLDPQLDPLLRTYNIVQGNFPSQSRYEIIITQSFASEKSYNLNEQLSVVTPSGLVNLKIVGLLSEEGAGLFNDGQVGFILINVFQDIFEVGKNVNEISIRVNPDIGGNPQKLEALKIQLQEKVGNQARVVYASARGNLLPEMLNTYQIGLSAFSIIAIIVGAFLIYNTFTMTIIERTTEIGMLRSIGMSRKQVLVLVLIEAFILSIIGSILGVLIGYLLSQILVYLQGGFIDLNKISLEVSNEDIMRSVGLGLAVTYASAIIPALQAARISPMEALRSKSKAVEKLNPAIWIVGAVLVFLGWLILYQLPLREEFMVSVGMVGFVGILVGFVFSVPIGVSLFEKSARWLASFLFGIEGRLGAANIHRSVSRTTLTVASLMVALIMIIGINSLAYSLKMDIQTWTNSAMAGDLYLSSVETFRPSFTQSLLEVPGIKAASPASYLQVKYDESNFPVQNDLPEHLILFSIDPALYLKVGDFVFSPGQGSKQEIWNDFLQGDRLLISTVVAEKTGLKKGDKLSLITKRGKHEYTISAVNTDFSSQGMTITGTFDDLKRWFSETSINRYSITLFEGYNPEVVSQNIKERFDHLYSINILEGLKIKQSVFKLLDQAFVLFDVLSMIGVVIGAIGIINTLTMNVLERTRELGGMRSLGMTRHQVVRMIRAESFSLGFIGGLYGLLMGYPISLIFIHVLNRLGGYEIEYIFNPTPYIIGFFVAFGVSQLAAIGPSSRASKINIIEAIKHE